jgi:hypothetical protein
LFIHLPGQPKTGPESQRGTSQESPQTGDRDRDILVLRAIEPTAFPDESRAGMIRGSPWTISQPLQGRGEIRAMADESLRSGIELCRPERQREDWSAETLDNRQKTLGDKPYSKGSPTIRRSPASSNKPTLEVAETPDQAHRGGRYSPRPDTSFGSRVVFKACTLGCKTGDRSANSANTASDCSTDKTTETGKPLGAFRWRH